MPASYRDVKSDILRRISTGDLRPGALLETEAELATHYGCARATVNRAMRELAEEGLIERKRKAGSRVRQAPIRQARFAIPLVREEIEAMGAAYRYALIARKTAPMPDWLRGRLGLEAARGEALHLECMHFADGLPYQHEDRWINVGVVPDVIAADFAEQGPNEWLVKAVPFSDAEIAFLAVEASAPLAAHLGCAEGDALFRTERVTWLEGVPITFVQLTNRRGHRMTTRY